MYYKLTFHVKNLEDIHSYLDIEDIAYIVSHEDSSTIDPFSHIKKHYHVVGKKCQFGYDAKFTYCKGIESTHELNNYYKYLTDGHCPFKVEYLEPDFERYMLTIACFKGYTLDNLLMEISENAERGIIKSQTYYLKKYGKAYLFNYKKIREIFDGSSIFIESKNKLSN